MKWNELVVRTRLERAADLALMELEYQYKQEPLRYTEQLIKELKAGLAEMEEMRKEMRHKLYEEVL